MQGINIFLSGFVPTENLRFRDEALTFKVSDSAAQLAFLCSHTCSCCIASICLPPCAGHQHLHERLGAHGEPALLR